MKTLMVCACLTVMAGTLPVLAADAAPPRDAGTAVPAPSGEAPAAKSRKGYDYYKAHSDIGAAAAPGNPLHEDQGGGGHNPLHEGKAAAPGTPDAAPADAPAR